MADPEPKELLHDASPYGVRPSDQINPVAEAEAKREAPNLGVFWRKKDPSDHSPTIITYTFDGLTDAQKRQFEEATRKIAEVANVRFVPFDGPGSQKTNTDADPSIPMYVVRNNPAALSAIPAQARADLPYRHTQFPYKQGVIEFNPQIINGVDGESPHSLRTMLHELDHALGGGHLDGDDSSKGFSAGKPPTFNLDSDDSVMAQRDGKIVSADGPTPSSTLGPTDIAIIQAKYGANPNSVLHDNTYAMDGKPGDIRTLWNGNHPITIDASNYEGDKPTSLNANNGGNNPSEVGNQHVFSAYGAKVDHLIGAKNANNNFTGSKEGGTTFQGGDKLNSYDILGPGNTVILAPPKDGILNALTLNSGTEVHIKGYDGSQNIQIYAADSKDHPLKVMHNGNNTELTAGNTHIILEDYRGPIDHIKVSPAAPPISVTPLEKAIADYKAAWGEFRSLGIEYQSPKDRASDLRTQWEIENEMGRKQQPRGTISRIEEGEINVAELEAKTAEFKQGTEQWKKENEAPALPEKKSPEQPTTSPHSDAGNGGIHQPAVTAGDRPKAAWKPGALAAGNPVRDLIAAENAPLEVSSSQLVTPKEVKAEFPVDTSKGQALA